MTADKDAKLAAAVGDALQKLKSALLDASKAGLKTYVHADDGKYEECNLTVEIAREYEF